MLVVGRLPIETQTKESARRDKRPSSVYCVSISCLYCMAQKHLLVGASLSTVCLYCVKHLLAYFRKHLTICWSIFKNSCWSIYKNSCWPIFKNICRVFALPLSLPPQRRAGKDKAWKEKRLVRNLLAL